MGLFSWLSGSEAQSRLPHLGKIEVEVIAREGSDGKVDWSHTVKTYGSSDGDKIKANRGEGYRITFDLDDYTDWNIRFDASRPFFCKDGTDNPCPDSITTKQVLVDSCDDGELVVIDWNYGEHEQELRYQLNFVTETGGPINPYDPIIINGGGGVRPPGSTS